MNITLDKADRALDRQEQYSRRNCLLIHGIDEENQENIDEVEINVFKKEMDKEDIDRSHHLGNRKPDKSKPRPIIIKFSRYYVGAKIFKNKRKLKGKRISVTESLTKTRMEHCRKLAKSTVFGMSGRMNGGKILYTDINDHNRLKVFYD